MSLYNKYKNVFRLQHMGMVAGVGDLPEIAAEGSIYVVPHKNEIYVYIQNDWQQLASIDMTVVDVIPKTPEQEDWDSHVEPLLKYIRTNEAVDFNELIHKVLKNRYNRTDNSRFNVFS